MVLVVKLTFPNFLVEELKIYPKKKERVEENLLEEMSKLNGTSWL